MSYVRRRARRSLSGVSSQPAHPRVSMRALSGVSSQPRRPRISLYALGDVAADPTQITTSTLATPTLTDPQWATDMVSAQREMTSWQKQWVKRDEMQRWIQIAATLSIPLAAAIWRALGLGRKPT